MTARDVLLMAALYAGLAAAILLGAMATGHADPLAWRIEVQTCRADACRTLAASAHRWGGRYACEGRAALMTASADLLPVAVRGGPIRARCVAIEGLPRA